jgi:phage-related protein
MPQSLPLPDKLSADIGKGINDSVLTAKFGDGYWQSAANGINASADTWAISWIWLSPTDRDTVNAALDTVGAWDYLTWTPRGESIQKRFKVVANSRRFEYLGNKTKIHCSLEQAF